MAKFGSAAGMMVVKTTAYTTMRSSGLSIVHRTPRTLRL